MRPGDHQRRVIRGKPSDWGENETQQRWMVVVAIALFAAGLLMGILDKW